MASYPELPDCPGIARTLQTGYPGPVRAVRCADCGGEFTGDREMYILSGGPVCGGCLLPRLLEDWGLSALAAALGIARTTAQDWYEAGEKENGRAADQERPLS